MTKNILDFFLYVPFCVIFAHLFQREEVKAKAGATSGIKDKGGAKDKNGKNSSSPAGLDKKTKLKRRDDVEPPKFIGKNSNLNQSCLGLSLIA